MTKKLTPEQITEIYKRIEAMRMAAHKALWKTVGDNYPRLETRENTK